MQTCCSLITANGEDEGYSGFVRIEKTMSFEVLLNSICSEMEQDAKQVKFLCIPSIGKLESVNDIEDGDTVFLSLKGGTQNCIFLNQNEKATLTRIKLR